MVRTVRITQRDRMRLPRSAAGHPVEVFVFFSSRLGCLGSLAVSALLTIVLLLAFDVL
ncbi:hypothetical protein [Blastococcus sp. CCUG 61487]|uniref:hypothetical protein n=1 Tax=Blastococcus sp. CCUG 61487 TaxID=1840703 RepID=UPI001484F2EB|nr:hypothetical protein [Blastococcus sp. CCUG 61487]